MPRFFELKRSSLTWSLKFKEKYDKFEIYLSSYQAFILLTVTLILQVTFIYGLRNDWSLFSRFYDGPNFLIVAKSFYQFSPEDTEAFGLASPRYFPSHFPLFPMLVRAVSVIVGWEWTLLTCMVFTTQLCVFMFYKFLKNFELAKDILLTSLLMLVFPIRFSIYQVLPATEPLFVSLLFGTLLAFHKQRYKLMSLCLTLLTLTKLVGIFFAAGLFFWCVRNKLWKPCWAIIASSWGVLAYVLYCYYIHGDFTVLIEANQVQQKHVRWPPFLSLASHFSQHDFRISESYFWQFVCYFVGLFLTKHKPILFWFCMPYLLFLCFEFHMDLTRYFLPLAPFLLIVPYASLISKPVKVVMILFLTSASHLYITNWAPTNAMPIPTFARVEEYLKK